MSPTPAPYDLAPLATLLMIGTLLAAVPFAWVWRRAGRGPAPRAGRLQALTLLTLCLTFDLVLFGAYTRLSDSGLGCPDWPGCYASASPLGARDAIHAAQGTAPAGPVTLKKAWIEMTHRYLATGVGALIAGLTAAGWWRRWKRSRRRGGAAPAGERRAAGAGAGGSAARASPETVSPWWPTATLAWVAVQGAFGAWTVTWKLYPLVVTAHLLGGLGLVALLAAQREAGDPARRRLPLGPGLRRAVAALAVLSFVQIALGGWVSTNYAVIACPDFPACRDAIWPATDFAAGFQPFRELGRQADGTPLPFQALTAIHLAHRLGAFVLFGGMALLTVALVRRREAQARRFAQATVAVVVWQAASGISTIVFDAPLASALAHTAGAAAWVVVLTTLLARSHRRGLPTRSPAATGRSGVPALSLEAAP